MPRPPTFLRNVEAVVSAFGHWPSFHDARVVAFHFDNEGPGVVDLTLHGWTMAPDIDERGFYKLTNHHLVRFRFSEISDADLDGFSADNILFGLTFLPSKDSTVSEMFTVLMDSAMGGDLSGSFSARSGEVTEVSACDSQGRLTEPFRAPNRARDSDSQV